MPFDKRAYMREYMRRKRAEDPSYGQARSKSRYGEEYEEDYDHVELNLTPKTLIVIIVGIGITVLLAWIYFKFFHNRKSKQEEWTI